MVGLTDADGDFVSYSVDVCRSSCNGPTARKSRRFRRRRAIDFAQLTDLSDLLSVASLAPGDFVKGSIRIDYTNADIEVQKGTDSVKATVVDGNGKPLGVTELEIRLDGRDHLVITKGRAAFLAVDFNLAASNTVDLTQTTPVVTRAAFHRRLGPTGGRQGPARSRSARQRRYRGEALTSSTCGRGSWLPEITVSSPCIPPPRRASRSTAQPRRAPTV